MAILEEPVVLRLPGQSLGVLLFRKKKEKKSTSKNYLPSRQPVSHHPPCRLISCSLLSTPSCPGHRWTGNHGSMAILHHSLLSTVGQCPDPWSNSLTVTDCYFKVTVFEAKATRGTKKTKTISVYSHMEVLNYSLHIKERLGEWVVARACDSVIPALWDSVCNAVYLILRITYLCTMFCSLFFLKGLE